MTQIEILKYALDGIMHDYELTRHLVLKNPCYETKAHRDDIVKKYSELKHLYAEEIQKQLGYQLQQLKYAIEIETPDGKSNKIMGEKNDEEFPNKEAAMRVYNGMKDLMGSPAGFMIQRVSLIENDRVIRSYGKGEL